MDRNGRSFLIAIAAGLLLFVACAGAPAQPGSMPEAAARLDAAQAEYARIAAQSTQQAAQATAARQAQVDAANAVATGTAVAATQTWQATADSLAVQQTQEAMAAQSTREAIGSHATETAVAQVAIVEQRLVADEATRLAIQRERERVAIRNEELWAAVWPWLVGVLVISLSALLVVAAFVIARRSQPMVIERGQNREPAVLIYSGGGYRQLAEPRAKPDEPVLLPPPLPSADLPALTSGHALVVGPTDAGKSTALRAIIRDRLADGQQVYVLDPHHQPGSWLDARVIGGGRDFEKIGNFMDWMMDQLNERARQMAAGSTAFGGAITVATDEMPAIVDELDRDTATIWRKWVREGRKFGLFLAVSTQSTRVKTLGIDGEGDVLQNFGAILYLGASAVEAYPDLVQQQERPAVLRTLRGAQPIIVPNIQPPGSGNGRGPMITAPAPAAAREADGGPDPYRRPENVGMSTPRGFVSPAEIRQIIELTRQGASGREIERAVWGYEGGGAYQMRIFVCDQLGLGG